MIIYLDMDDVVADWHEAAQVFLKQRWQKNGDRLPDSEWDKIKQESRFYRNLPLMPGATELVKYCLDAVYSERADGVRFLSAIPRNNDMPWAIQDKVWWAYDHFPGIPVFLGPYSDDKWQHCRPGDILIDDRTDNCMQWENAGGHAHIYRTWEGCKPWLEQILNSKVAE